MTSKEALERYYSNLHYGVGGFQTDDEESEALNTIKQDLERLEQVEKENQELKEKADKYDELCKHNVMDNQDFGDNLIQGILALNTRVIERNKKLKKAIEILKTYFDFTFDDNYPFMNIKSKISCDGKGTTNCIQAVENYRLLKEVLGNE